MFSLAHFFLRCCHTFFTSALGLLPWTSTLREWCKSEKFWKFQILTKFKFKLNIIFSEKIGKIQKKSEKFQIFKKKWKIQKKIWKFQIFRNKIWKKHKKSENFRFSENMKNSEKNLKISDFQKKSENQIFRKKSENFRENLKISDFQKKNLKKIRKNLKISNFKKKSEKIRKNLKISDFQKKIWKFQKK